MKINRNNCEAWFLDYYEGNLSDGQAGELFAFLELHPDLREVFESYDAVSFDPDAHVRFDAKDALKKTVEPASGINDSNYEEFIVGAIEGTLSAEEQTQLENYLSSRPSKRAELELLRQTILTPDADIVFEDKASLKKATLINETNFAEYAVAFTDGELPGETLAQFEAFVAAHPELKAELDLFSATKLQPDTTIVFEDKASLRRELVVVTHENFDAIAAASVDGQLNAAEEKALNDYLVKNPAQQSAYALYGKTKLQADTSIVFEEKASLYRKEKDRGAFWWVTDLRFAAAAAVLLFVAIFWWSRPGNENLKDNGGQLAKDDHSQQHIVTPNADTNASPVIVPNHNDQNNSASQLATKTPHIKPTLPPAQHVFDAPQMIASTNAAPLKRTYEPGVNFSDVYYSETSTTAAPASQESLSLGQFAMRWMKSKLDARPSKDDEDNEGNVYVAYNQQNEDRDVSGFDVTRSALDRFSDATGSNLHLNKTSEGTMLIIGKYDILLNRKR